MSKDANFPSRRGFLKVTAAGAVTVGTGLTNAAVAQEGGSAEFPLSQPGRVVKVSHSGAMDDPNRPGSDPVGEVVAAMVDTALLAYTGLGDIGQAWSQFINPSDKVMIKVNALGSPGMSTNRTVVEAIIRGLQVMGLPNENMLVYDQYGNRMRSADFRPGRDILGVAVEFSRNQGYSDDEVDTGSGRTRFSVALENSTAVINVPVFKDHDICGVTAAMKNMTHGVIETPSDFHRAHRTEGCEVHANLWSQSQIKDKVRVTIADGLRVLYQGGPQDSDNKILHNSVYCTTDPVAMDTIAHEVIAAARADHGEDSLEDSGRPCNWLAVCAARGLGVADRDQINLEEYNLG
ncbi:MAG: DUF362 domain-containing protein [Myxococcales bacterium]|nr:DUF362 domain-containing protein [Myxococcales bacterium]